MAASDLPFAPLAALAPGARFLLGGRKVPRQAGRASGRTAVGAAANVAETAPPEDRDSPLAFTMEGEQRAVPPSLNSRYWAPGWNSVQALTKYQVEAGGMLWGGESGRRLIEPVPESAGGAPDAVFPAPFAIKHGEWLAVPLHHLYGSEELSMLSPVTAARSPGPYVALGAPDAAGLNLADGDAVVVTAGMHRCTLPCRITAGLPAGIAGLPVGLAGMPVIDLPCRITIGKIGGGP